MSQPYITRARAQAGELIRLESRGPGDTANAIARVARRARLSKSMLWSLRYRPPKSLPWDFVEAIKTAYAAACRAQAQHLLNQAEKIRGTTNDVDPTVLAQAEALARNVLEQEAAP